MKVPSTTIDNLSIQAHQEYAKNLAVYDKSQGIEAPSVRKLAELAGTSSIYVSQVDTILGLGETPSTWANFIPPPGYTEKTNRFFFLRLFPSGKTPHEEVEILFQMIDALPERDRKSMTTFAKEYERVSDLITEAYSRILALQKS